MAGETAAYVVGASGLLTYDVRLEQVMFCTICQEDRLFVGAGCVDGHDADCPERLCVECGFAVLVSDLLVEQVAAAASVA